MEVRDEAKEATRIFNEDELLLNKNKLESPYSNEEGMFLRPYTWHYWLVVGCTEFNVKVNSLLFIPVGIKFYSKFETERNIHA